MVHIDGIIFSLQPQGGVAVCFRELLKRLGGGQGSVLTLESPLMQSLSAQDTPGTSMAFRKARWMERYRNCRRPVGPSATVFHSTYYRCPEDPEVPTVVTVHDFAYERVLKGPKTWVHHLQKRAAISRAQVIICVSEATRKDLLELLPPRPGQRVEVVYNGVSGVFHPLDPPVAVVGRPYVLYVGRRGGYKNFGLALRALEHLPDVELWCVGGGPLETKELFSLGTAVRARIRALANVDEVRLNELYNGAVCLLYPSAFEGFGLPVVEAMRAGCPVVGISCAAVLEVGGAALRVAEPDGRSIAQCVSGLASGEARMEIRSLGLENSVRFDWESNFDKISSIYRSLS